MKHLFLMMMLMACLIACAPTQENGTGSDIEAIVDAYKDWTRLTSQPRNLTFDLLIMCRTMTEAEQGFMDSEHAERYTHVYVSDQGAATIIQESERTFPVGSVIVKEKLINADDTLPKALGIMIKRERGFNPQGDDWEYAYWEQGSITRGTEQLEHCQACHMQQAAMDSVFWP